MHKQAETEKAQDLVRPRTGSCINAPIPVGTMTSDRYMNGSFWQRNQCARMWALVMHTVENARLIGKSRVSMHTQGESPDPAGATNQGLWVADSWRW